MVIRGSSWRKSRSFSNGGGSGLAKGLQSRSPGVVFLEGPNRQMTANNKATANGSLCAGAASTATGHSIGGQTAAAREFLRVTVTSSPMQIPPKRDGQMVDCPNYHVLALEASQVASWSPCCLSPLTEPEQAQPEQMHGYLAPRPKRIQRIRFVGEMHDLSRLAPMKYEWTIDPSISRDPLRFEVPVDYSKGCQYSLIVDGEFVARDQTVPS